MKKHFTQISRRTFLKASIAAAAAPMILTARKSDAQAVPVPPSPLTTPWVEYLPDEITPLHSVNTLNPPPTVTANVTGGEAGRADHQRFDELTAPGVARTPELHQLTAKENPSWVFNPAYPAQPIWGYAGPTGDATTPGPTIFARYGQSIICRIYNDLPPNHVGFGTPEISTHLHNLHTPSESDGFPGDFYSATQAGPTVPGPNGAGEFKDHFYPNVYAGLVDFGGIGNPKEALGTLWYHDHTMDFTAPNILRGLLGFNLIFDALDSGNEHDTTAGALKLPSHPYDYPIVLQDKRFDADGKLFFDQLDPEGTLGDKTTVNGKIEPVLRVARRKYRFRFLNGGPSRFYELYLQNKGATAVYPFTYIANDGNLLPKPLLNQFKVRLGAAERGDIVVDFSKFPLNTELYFVNQLLQDRTRRADDVKAPGTRLLKIIVNRNAADPSVVPANLRTLPDIPAFPYTGVPTRQFVFERDSGLWTINGLLFDANVAREVVPQSSVGEIWELVNLDNGWSHPIHIHFEEGRIIEKTLNGVIVPIPAHERGRKDVFNLDRISTVKVFIRFRDFKGKYLMHCHNLIHEDHAMMLRFDIVTP